MFTVGVRRQRSWTLYCFAPGIGDPALKLWAWFVDPANKA